METGAPYAAAAAALKARLYFNAESYIGEAMYEKAATICQDIIDFFQSRNGRNDSTCPHCGDKPKPSTIPAKPEFDSGITPLPYDTLPGDTNGNNKIAFL